MKIRGLTILGIISFLVVFWINFIDFKLPTFSFFIGKSNKLESIIENLCLAYLGAYFFYFINIYLVERREKRKALPYISYKVKIILSANHRFCSILFQNKNVKVFELTREQIEKVLDKKHLKNLKIYQHENLSLIEFISKNRKSILVNISKVLESGKYVDEELKILLLEMRESLFLKENYAFNLDNIELDTLKKYHNVLYKYINQNRNLQKYFEKNLRRYYLLNYPRYFRKKVK